MNLVSLLLPELILIAVAMALFLLGLSDKASSRRLGAWVALSALVVVFAIQLFNTGDGVTRFDTPMGDVAHDSQPHYGTVRLAPFAQYVKLMTAGMGILLTLLAWPTNRDATGNYSAHFGHDAGEFYALMLLSIAGVLLVAGANDIMLLFLGIELASIPTYIMVSLSRPTPIAQEAGVKYFFLGAFAAAIMLFGFSYLYGTTGSTNLYEIMLKLHRADGGGVVDWGSRAILSPWQSLAVIMLVAGFAFKMAAVPLHFYVGDVYQGAATPVTAFLAFIPKTSGFVALIKLMFALGGPNWMLPEPLVRPSGTGLLWILAILTMSIGNVLALLQHVNVKRTLAYSSVAHTGYMLAALAALGAGQYSGGVATDVNATGVQAVLFYLAAYGLMNVGAFGILQLLPAHDGSGSAETFDDLLGSGRHRVALGLCMSVCCFSLTGIPLTVGFMAKLMIIKPALAAAVAPVKAGMISVRPAMAWLAAIVMVNAAISAAYYLRIVATMFLRTEDPHHPGIHPVQAHFARPALPILLAVILSVGGTLLFGLVPSATELLGTRTLNASNLEGNIPSVLPAVPTKAVAATR